MSAQSARTWPGKSNGLFMGPVAYQGGASSPVVGRRARSGQRTDRNGRGLSSALQCSSSGNRVLAGSEGFLVTSALRSGLFRKTSKFGLCSQPIQLARLFVKKPKGNEPRKREHGPHE